MNLIRQQLTQKIMRGLIPCIFALCAMLAGSVKADQLPTNLQAALILKVMGLEKGIKNKDHVEIFILDAPDIASILKTQIGRKIGNATLTDVAMGKHIPEKRYDMIYIGNPYKSKEVLIYSSKSKVLSIYPNSDKIAEKGTLGIGIKSGKPIVLLNLESSKEEGLNWEPNIIKIAIKI